MRWEDLLDEARADASRAERSRLHWLGQQARESATLLGSLVDLAESGVRVSLRLAGGHRVDGALTLVGVDVVALADGARLTVVASDAIAVVRPAPGDGADPATGDRGPVVDLTFVEVLARLGAEPTPVAVGLRDGDVVGGDLVATGADVLSVRVAPGGAGLAYVSAASVSFVRLG